MSLPQPSPLTPDPLLHSPDPFLLITRIPTRASTSSNPASPLLRPGTPSSQRRYSHPILGPQGIFEHLWSFSRCWTLLFFAPFDLAYGIYQVLLSTHSLPYPPSPLPPSLPSSELSPLLALSLLRPIILATVAATRNWRKRMSWVVVVVIGTWLGVAWEVNWLVQVKTVAPVAAFVMVGDRWGGIGWFLIWQSVSALLAYTLYLIPLRLSPISPYPPLPPPIPSQRRFFRRRLSAARRRQHPVNMEWEEEEVGAGVSSVTRSGSKGRADGDGKGKGRMRGHERQESRGSLRWGDERTASEAESSARDGTLLSPTLSSPKKRLSASPCSQPLESAAETGEDEEDDPEDHHSIGRFSDEGEHHEENDSSDDSISSNEIVDLPPPVRSGSMAFRASQSDLRIRTGARVSGDEGGWRSPHSFTRLTGRPASPRDLIASPVEFGGEGGIVDEAEAARLREEDEREEEEEERERLRSSETRLERGLSRRWRSAKGWLKRGKKGSTGPGGGTAGRGAEYGTFGR